MVVGRIRANRSWRVGASQPKVEEKKEEEERRREGVEGTATLERAGGAASAGGPNKR